MKEIEAKEFKRLFIAAGIKEVRIVHRNEVRGVWLGEYGIALYPNGWTPGGMRGWFTTTGGAGRELRRMKEAA
jgi:hypothetical protein